MTRETDPLLSLPDKSGVLYVRLYQRMRALIAQGSWPPGMRLPSSRGLAADLGISRNTATMALDQLLADGWIHAKSRAGTFVRQRGPASADSIPAEGAAFQPGGRPPLPFELAQGAIDAFPIRRWARLQAQVWSRAVPDLLYESDMAGDFGLRAAIASVVAPSRGLTAAPDDILVTTSTQSALDLIAAALPPQSTVVVEDPGYIFADAAFTTRGHRIVPVAVDAHGLDVAAGRAVIPKPAAILVTPSCHFPSGAPMSADRRAALLDWAREAGAWIIEDDFDAGMRFDGAAPSEALKSIDEEDQVILIASFNRLLFHSLRLGFMIVPQRLRAALMGAREAVDQHVNLPNQVVLGRFIHDGGFAAHLRACRSLYQERRTALLAVLKPFLGSLFDEALNPCGLYLLARPLAAPAGPIAGSLRSSGIACVTLDQLTRRRPVPEGVIFGFAAFSPDVIEATGPVLDSALRPFLGEP